MAQKEPNAISLPVEIHGSEANFIRCKVLPFSGTGKLDVSNAVTSHRHRESRDGITRSLAARHGWDTSTIHHVAIGIERFEHSRRPGRTPEQNGNRRNRRRKSRAYGNRFHRHSALEPLCPVERWVKNISKPFPLVR